MIEIDLRIFAPVIHSLPERGDLYKVVDGYGEISYDLYLGENFWYTNKRLLRKHSYTEFVITVIRAKRATLL